MFWQHEYVREAVSMTLNDVYRLDLPEHGLLGSLFFRISGSQASGYGQAAADWRIIDEISKVEIIADGSTVIKSLTGYELQALATWDQGIIPPGAWKNYATNTQWEHMLLNFGRKMFDVEYGLDLSRFKNIELKVTNTATSSDFSDLTISVLGLYLRDSPAGTFRGYLRTEEWRSWTTVADETQYLDLPVEHIIRRILLQAIPSIDSAEVESTNMLNLMDDIEHSLDTGQVRMFKGGIDDLMRINALHLGVPLIVAGSHYMSADQGVDISLGYVGGGAWGAGSQDGAGAAVIATMETGRTSFTQKPETYEADSPIGFMFLGIAPFLTAVLHHDPTPDPLTWLNPQQRATVELNIHTRNASSAASGRNAVVLDRLVT